MSKPVIGDVVLYKLHACEAEDGHGRPGEVCAAVVTRVWSDDCVNLRLMTDSPKVPPRVTSKLRGDGAGEWIERDGIATSPSAAENTKFPRGVVSKPTAPALAPVADLAPITLPVKKED